MGSWLCVAVHISPLTFDLCAGDEGVFDPGEDRNNSELLSLLKQESGENPVFEGYRVSFEDQYGDLHDWQSGVTTQLYLCRQLYIHYNSQVRHLVRNLSCLVMRLFVHAGERPSS